MGGKGLPPDPGPVGVGRERSRGGVGLTVVRWPSRPQRTFAVVDIAARRRAVLRAAGARSGTATVRATRWPASSRTSPCTTDEIERPAGLCGRPAYRPRREPTGHRPQAPGVDRVAVVAAPVGEGGSDRGQGAGRVGDEPSGPPPCMVLARRCRPPGRPGQPEAQPRDGADGRLEGRSEQATAARLSTRESVVTPERRSEGMRRVPRSSAAAPGGRLTGYRPPSM